MTQSDLQFRVAHTLRTYKRLHEDLRQAIFSGHHVTPEVSLHRPKNSAFGMWIDAAIAQHGEKERELAEAIKTANIQVHEEAVEIAALIRAHRPDEAHARFHAPAFSRAMATLIDGLEHLRVELKRAA